MATNVNLNVRNCCQDFSNPYVYAFDHTQQALVVKNETTGSVISSYPLDTYITEVYTSYFDGLFFWSLELSYSGMVIRRWILSSNILRRDKTFSYVSADWIQYSSRSFSVIHNTTNLSSPAPAGATYLEVDDVSDFSLADNIYVGVNETFGQYEQFNISGIDGDNDIIHLDRASTHSYATDKAVVKLGRVWIYNDYSPFDATEASVLKVNSTTGVLEAYQRSGMYKAVEAAGAYEGNIIIINGHSVLHISSTTSQITSIMYIDNLGQDRGSILPIYSMFIKDDYLYRLQTSRVYYDSGWQEEDWSPYYNFVKSATTAQTYFVEVFSTPDVFHKVATPDIPTVTSDVTVRVLTQYRVPISGKYVTLSSSKGSMSPPAGTTNSDGELISTYNGTTYEGSVSISATAN